MWPWINQTLKRMLPPFHNFLKDRVAAWRLDPSPRLPVMRRVRGRFFWIHPRLLTVETRDAEPHIYGWIVKHLPRGGVFFDVGAHYGWLSLQAARHVGRNGRVVAFEPSPVLLEILRYHQRCNRLKQMSVIGSAVSERDAGRADFYLLNGGLSSRNSLMIGEPGLPFLDSIQKSIAEVPTITLDRFCEAEGLVPDLIKIDVEGAEGMVLRGAATVLRRFRPVIVLSTHPYWLPASESVEAMLAFLAGYGYRVEDSHVVRFEGYEIGDYLLSA